MMRGYRGRMEGMMKTTMRVRVEELFMRYIDNQARADSD